MEKAKAPRLLWLNYIVVLVIGFGIGYILSSPAVSCGDVEVYSPIDDEAVAVEAAKAYVEANPDSVRAIVINRDMFKAMRSLSVTTKPYDGFRIYHGLINNRDTALVLRIVKKGNFFDDDLSKVYLTRFKPSGLCPTLCDEDGPINVDPPHPNPEQ